MEILGNSYQEKEPTPDNPVEIKNYGYVPAIYENKECDIIGENNSNYLIYIYDIEEDDYITKIVSKKEVKIRED